MIDPVLRRREVLAWALYDWANSAFATVVIAGVFPVAFKQYWNAGVDATISSFRLGMANSLESLIVFAIAPLIGAVADQGGLKKKSLLTFAALGVLATGALILPTQAQWVFAAMLYVLAGIGFAAANVFYDALLVDVSEEHTLDLVSAFGFSLGYLGGGIALGLCVAMIEWPSAFGFAGRSEAVKAAFLLTAIWWAAFASPFALITQERRRIGPQPVLQAMAGGFRQLIGTFRKIRSYRVIVLFLVGYWLYIDGVGTVVRMAVDYGMALGFRPKDLIAALLIVQFVGFPAALAYGWLGARMGPKVGIFIGILGYLGITLWGYRMHAIWEFYGIAVAIGLMQGGIQSLSRSLYARIIPGGQAAEFFGFYNLVGKLAALVGPALMGSVAVITQDTRLSILSLIVLFLGGAIPLLFVDERVRSSNR